MAASSFCCSVIICIYFFDVYWHIEHIPWLMETIEECKVKDSTVYYSIHAVSDTQYGSYDRVAEHILVTSLVSNA
jgi:hypothetical protein